VSDDEAVAETPTLPAIDLSSEADRLRMLAAGYRASAGAGPAYGASGPVESEALHQLANDLEARPELFRGINLLTAFPPEAVLPDLSLGEEHQRLRRLTLWRDMLIFAPIAFTWWQLWLVMGNLEDSEVPLFQQWQSGSADSALGFSLGTCALVTALLILLIVALTAVIHRREGEIEARGSRAGHRRDLAREFGLVTLALARDTETAATHARALGSPLELVATATAIQAGIDQLADAVAQIGSEITGALTTGPGSELSDAIQQWSRTASSLDAAVGSLAGPAEAMTTFAELRRDMVASENQIRERISALVLALQQSAGAAAAHEAAATAMQRGMGELQRGLDVFQSRTEVISGFVLVMHRFIEQFQEENPDFALDYDDGSWGAREIDLTNERERNADGAGDHGTAENGAGGLATDENGASERGSSEVPAAEDRTGSWFDGLADGER
jgi:hypothetical protein